MRVMLTLIFVALGAWLLIWPGLRRPAVANSSAIIEPENPSGPRANNNLLQRPWGRRPPETTGERLAKVFSGQTPASLNRAEIEVYLASGKTNPFSLVVAFDTSANPEYLRQAAELFPDDPFVQAKAVLHDAFPEERAKWLNALKQSAPGNSLPYLMAAADMIKNGNIDGAINEITAAGNRTFDDFARPSMIGLEEAFLENGRSAAEAKALGAASIRLPHLTLLQESATKMIAAARQRAASGDATSHQNALAAAWAIGSQLRAAGESSYLVTDYIGMSVQNMVLENCPPGTQPPFLDRLPAEYLQDNGAYKTALNDSVRIFNEWLPNAKEHEIMTYYDRLRTYGEYNALDWLRNRQVE